MHYMLRFETKACLNNPYIFLVAIYHLYQSLKINTKQENLGEMMQAKRLLCFPVAPKVWNGVGVFR